MFEIKQSRKINDKIVEKINKYKMIIDWQSSKEKQKLKGARKWRFIANELIIITRKMRFIETLYKMNE